MVLVVRQAHLATVVETELLDKATRLRAEAAAVQAAQEQTPTLFRDTLTMLVTVAQEFLAAQMAHLRLVAVVAAVLAVTVAVLRQAAVLVLRMEDLVTRVVQQTLVVVQVARGSTAMDKILSRTVVRVS
jgi:hypothetical protein